MNTIISIFTATNKGKKLNLNTDFNKIYKILSHNINLLSYIVHNIITHNNQWLGLVHNNMLWKHEIESSEVGKEVRDQKVRKKRNHS